MSAAETAPTSRSGPAKASRSPVLPWRSPLTRAGPGIPPSFRSAPRPPRRAERPTSCVAGLSSLLLLNLEVHDRKLPLLGVGGLRPRSQDIGKTSAPAWNAARDRGHLVPTCHGLAQALQASL